MLRFSHLSNRVLLVAAYAPSQFQHWKVLRENWEHTVQREIKTNFPLLIPPSSLFHSSPLFLLLLSCRVSPSQVVPSFSDFWATISPLAITNDSSMGEQMAWGPCARAGRDCISEERKWTECFAQGFETLDFQGHYSHLYISGIVECSWCGHR